MTAKKRNIILIAVVLVLLSAAVGVLSWMNQSGGADVGDTQRGNLKVLKNGEIVKEFTMEEIQKLDYIEVEKEIVSSSHENDEGFFRGAAVNVILKAAAADILDGAQQITARSEDGFVMAFSPEEVMEEGNLLVVYSKDGKALKTMDEGGSGPLRIVIRDDSFGNRSVKYLASLEVE